MRSYKNGKQYWKERKITKYIGKMMYGIKSRKDIGKRHRRQFKKRLIENEPDRLKEPWERFYDVFRVPATLHVVEPMRTGRRKKKNTKFLQIDIKKIIIFIWERKR